MNQYDAEINETSSKILQQKLKKMTDRNEQRKTMETKRRRERFEFGSQAEQTDVFTDTFKQHKKQIEAELTSATNACYEGENRTQLSLRLDNVFRIIEALKKYLTESSMFLTSFDNEQAKNDFQDIISNFNKTRDSLLPQKKFGFGNRTKRTTNTSDDVKESPIKVHNKLEVEQRFGFIDKSDEELSMLAGEVTGKDVIVSNVTNCTIKLLGNPGSIFLRNVKGTLLISGPISRSVMIEDCDDCNFYFAAQQGRIHKTHRCNFYIHVTSSAIIEHCDELKFAPYLLQYPQLPQHYLESKLNTEINNWDKIEDFRHLASNVASPNWSIIPEAERHMIILNNE